MPFEWTSFVLFGLSSRLSEGKGRLLLVVSWYCDFKEIGLIVNVWYFRDWEPLKNFFLNRLLR